MDNLNINLSPMKPEHIEAVYNIGKKSLAEAWELTAINNELNNPIAHYIVALNYNKVIGFGGLWIIVGEANVTNIAVDHSYRNLGIGNLIMEELFKTCKINNASSITLEVRSSNIIAQSLYEKFGFINEGIRKNFYADKEDAVIMWCRF